MFKTRALTFDSDGRPCGCDPSIGRQGAADIPPIDTVFVLDERTVFPVLVQVLRGRMVCVLGVEPMLLPFEPVLARLEGWLVVSGRAVRARDVNPAEADGFLGLEHYAWRATDFDSLDKGVAERYRLSADDFADGYASGRRAGVWQHLLTRMYQSHALRRVVAREIGPVEVRGPEELHRILENIGPVAGLRWKFHAKVSTEIVNGINALITFSVGAAWLLSRTRRTPTSPRSRAVATNPIVVEDMACIRDAVGPGNVLLIARRRKADVAHLATDGIAIVGFEDIRIVPRRQPTVLAGFAADLIRCLRRYRSDEPTVFRKVLSLAFARIRYRLLFDSLDIAAFCSWDDYNEEHAVRAHELRRRGITSIGLLNGIYTVSRRPLTIRHVDNDVCVTLSRHDVAELEKEWPDRMRVVAAPSNFLRPSLLSDPDPEGDIAVLFNCAVGLDEKIALLDGLRTSVPECRLRLQIKPGATSRLSCAPIRAWAEARGIAVAREPTERVLVGAAVVISDESSVSIEAVQFGRPTLLLDVIPDLPTMTYRDYPGFCFRTADAAVARVRALLDGTEQFDFPAFARMMNLEPGLRTDLVLREVRAAAAETAHLDRLPSDPTGHTGDKIR